MTTGTSNISKYLSPMNVWALSLGCAVGWGAFVMPATTLLPKAGPIGVVLAMIAVALIIIIIAANFHFMMNRYPDSGGAITFTKKTFGFDHAFLCAWSLILAYVSIMWANATAFILVSRYLLGGIFEVGYLYQIAGYDVYLGEAIVTLVILAAFGLFACGHKTLVNSVNTVLAVIMFGGVVICFIAVAMHGSNNPASFTPAFVPEDPVGGAFGVVALAPWAFLGFEAVSHATDACNFPLKKVFPILVLAVSAGAIIYILTTLISVIGMPGEYDSWMSYLANLGNMPGYQGLPTFAAVHASMGDAGLTLLGVVVIAAVSTSLIGLYRTAGRLVCAIAEDGIIPAWLSVRNRDGVPRNAILAIMGISAIVPFVGRAAIGWIVDVTSVSAAIVYGYTSACSVATARKEGNVKFMITGVIGLVFSVIFLVYPLIPGLSGSNALAAASYLILAAWSIVGLILFRAVFRRDRDYRFGKSTVVWVFMIFLVFFSATMWTRQVTYEVTEDVIDDVSVYYEGEYASYDFDVSSAFLARERAYLETRTNALRENLLGNSLVQMALIVFSIAIMLNIYSLIRRREQRTDEKRSEAEDATRAKTTFLSNMSHDIRTPMNAIIGYTHMARKDGTSAEDMRAYLEKIDASSQHLLALINDVLEMSRIESGKMELDPTQTDLVKALEEVHDMFATQMREKNIDFSVEFVDVSSRYVMCDKNRLNRVLLNLLSNAYKFTPEGGSVSVTLRQLEASNVGRGAFELRVKDSGIGMSEEFAEKVFESFERERNTTVSGIQGTGLGMAITKSIVDIMGGTIEVVTAPNEGTEFIIKLSFDLVDEAAIEGAADSGHNETAIDFTGMRILLAEDNEINREIASFILEDAGFEVEVAENGQVAVDKVTNSDPGYYDIVLMDVQMPVMNGYDATRAIRALDNPGLANIPIVAATANAFAEDVHAAREAGMDGHISKPLDVDKVLLVFQDLLGA